MKRIFDIALIHNHDCIVLSALGCGAYKNPPAHIAQLFYEVLEESYRGKFRIIIFAIIDDKNTGLEHNPEGNLLPFLKQFHKSEADNIDSFLVHRKLNQLSKASCRPLTCLPEYMYFLKWYGVTT